MGEIQAPGLPCCPRTSGTLTLAKPTGTYRLWGLICRLARVAFSHALCLPCCSGASLIVRSLAIGKRQKLFRGSSTAMTQHDRCLCRADADARSHRRCVRGSEPVACQRISPSWHLGRHWPCLAPGRTLTQKPRRALCGSQRQTVPRRASTACSCL